ncbi:MULTISPECIES: hypothetical protein [Pirellulaceae]|nr:MULTISPECIES: hypothetical protein [Pirellulaceae]
MKSWQLQQASNEIRIYLYRGAKEWDGASRYAQALNGQNRS